MAGPNPTGDVRTFTVRVPILIRRRGGRKLVLAPDGTPDIGAVLSRRVDNAMVKAVARAFRWREMLEDGTYATIREIAVAKKINEFLRRSRTAADAAGARHRRGDPGWTAAGGAAARGSAEAVSGGVARAASGNFEAHISRPHLGQLAEALNHTAHAEIKPPERQNTVILRLQNRWGHSSGARASCYSFFTCGL